ncbi:tocopherol cyclase [Raphidocelis subcapitata]|uniref:Tocopherol cyclase n=1 Tax=Raphidocelis subcapitata TaxID=307507 RepID=A0A2V0P9V7_9CHLO|nr:tocopherol cyclase [Raphidocelis subcapitata]|eukprot:GBF94640.1 tocopherol cyclase [Raphidocelis subcapitata]
MMLSRGGGGFAPPAGGRSSRAAQRRGGAAVARHARCRCVRATAAASSSSWAPVPHSGYHFDGSSRRFFEGWYWRVALPDCGQSFAFMFSVEDPGDASSGVRGVGAQVMGIDDGYICQFSRDTGSFWGARNSLELGATFSVAPGAAARGAPRRIVTQSDFDASVEAGFQASATWQQGSIVAMESGAAGAPMSTVPSCSWAFRVTPHYGWGDAGPGAGGGARPGRATAGWLSALAVFEPHWQVLMAYGTAEGWVQWGDKRYELTGAPAYAEKNWGGGFPSKWIWAQCNTFDGMPGLALTAVGARRGLLGVPGLEEDVGMAGIHLPGGKFVELTPWTGDVEWSADAWGRWRLRAAGAGYEAVVDATAEPGAGTVLRAPTATEGLAPRCKDTFFGTLRLRLWQVDSAGRRSASPLVDATSSTAALEVGGGPWWSPWSARADMREPFKSLVKLPIDLGALASAVPQPLRPPGL